MAKSVNSYYFGLLKRYYAALRIPSDEREAVRKEIQGGRSLSKIPREELQSICRELERQLDDGDGDAEDSDKMRKKVIGLLTQSGMKKDDKPCMAQIYPYVKKYGYLKKGLNEYTKDELPKLVTQMERIVQYRIKKNLKVTDGSETGNQQEDEQAKEPSSQNGSR